MMERGLVRPGMGRLRAEMHERDGEQGGAHGPGHTLGSTGAVMLDGEHDERDDGEACKAGGDQEEGGGAVPGREVKYDRGGAKSVPDPDERPQALPKRQIQKDGREHAENRKRN